MNNDAKTTVGSAVSGAGYVTGFALLPEPWNYVAIVVGFIAQVVTGFFTNKADNGASGLKASSFMLPIAFLTLAGCGTSTIYLKDAASGEWTRVECEQSDREYRLSDKQYHCEKRIVTAKEAEAMRR